MKSSSQLFIMVLFFANLREKIINKLHNLLRFLNKVCEIESIRRLSYRQDINTLRAVAVLAGFFIMQSFNILKVVG